MEQKLRIFLSRYTLSTMFSIIIFIVAMIVSTAVQSFKYQESKTVLEQNLHSKAESILDFADVLLESRNEKFFSGESSEVPQMIQNEIFDKFTKNSKGKVFFKEASISPTDPKNKALPYEEQMIDYFKAHKEAKDATQTITHNQKKYYMYARPILSEKKCQQCHPMWTNPGDVIAVENVLIDLSDFGTALQKSIYSSVVLWIVNIVILLMVINFLFKKLVSRRIEKILKIIMHVEKGNFLIDDYVKDENTAQKDSNNEIDNIFRHLISMVNSLKPVIANVVKESKNVVFESVYGFAKIHESTQLSHQQSKVVQDSSTSIDHILNVNQNLEYSLENLLHKTQDAIGSVDDGKSIVTDNFNSSQHAANAMMQTVETIAQLKQFSNDISSTITKITDIANETNLISLNAAIEASRAGEHGRGFAVVAEKIRQLADISLENASNISRILQQMHQNVETVASQAESTNKTIETLKNSSVVLQHNFENIQDAIMENNAVLETFRENFKEEKDALGVVTESLENVRNSSTKLNDNALIAEESMAQITQHSGMLERLADGFDVLYSNRRSTREIVTPVIRGKIFLQNGTKLDGFIFDVSDHGISVVVTEHYKDIDLKTHDSGYIILDKPVREKTKYDFKIVHVFLKKENGTRQFGASI